MNYKYLKIKNPNTSRFVNINSKLGKNILQKYLRWISGGSSPNQMENITHEFESMEIETGLNDNEFNFDGLSEIDKEIWLQNCTNYCNLKDINWEEEIGMPLSELQENQTVLDYLQEDMPHIVCSKELCGVGKIPVKIIKNVWRDYVLSLDKDRLLNMTKIIEIEPHKIDFIINDIMGYYKNIYLKE